MNDDNLKYYLYEQKYLKFSDKILKISNNIKGNILEFLFKRKRLLKKHAQWERYILKKRKWLKKHQIFIEDRFKQKEYNYTDINLKEISFFEVIEIDDFNKFRKKLLSKFGNLTDSIGANRKEDVQERLDNLENKFDNISSGDLFVINYTKSRSKENDLIDRIHCSFIKTNESYFIISFDIKFSEKSREIIKSIFEHRDIALSIPNYNNYIKIIKERRFYNKTYHFRSLMVFNLQNFITDLSSQVKKNVTRYFDGYFQKSKIFKILPCIQLFEVSDIEKFRADTHLENLYRESFGRHYSLDDKQIEVHSPNSWDIEYEVIQIYRQSGHKSKEMIENDLSEWDSLERYLLIRSLSFPCVFSGIIKEQNLKLNSLKREIYDQIKLSGSKNIIKHLFLLRNNKYLQLKHKSLQVLLTIKRFENDFTNNKIRLYTEDYNLEEFKPRNFINPQEKNLLEYFVQSFRFQINFLKKKTTSLNEVFKSLEELNSYKTNFILQLFSIFIAILAFIFAFDKTKEFIDNIVKLVFK